MPKLSHTESRAATGDRWVRNVVDYRRSFRPKRRFEPRNALLTLLNRRRVVREVTRSSVSLTKCGVLYLVQIANNEFVFRFTQFV